MPNWGWLGIFRRALEFADGQASEVSPPGRGRIRYNNSTKQFEISENGGAYSPIGEVGEGGWTDDGAIVRLTTASDTVAVGAAAMSGGEKLRVIGDVRIEGDMWLDSLINFDGSAAAPRQIFPTKKTTPGPLAASKMEIFGGEGSDAADPATAAGAGGSFNGEGGVGGAGTGVLVAGGGGSAQLTGGFGGSSGGAGGGVGGDAEINGGPGNTGAADGKVRIAFQNTSVVEIGNVTDNPPTNFLGTGIVSIAIGSFVVGGSSMYGTEKLRVIGDVHVQGDIDFPRGPDHNIQIQQAADNTNGDQLLVQSGPGGDGVGTNGRVGGRLWLLGGNGGDSTTVGALGGVGGSAQMFSGDGGGVNAASGTGGVGGLTYVKGGAGGTGDSGADAGTGGSVVVEGGAAGVATGGGNDAAGGAVNVVGGAGSGTTGPGGSVNINGGAAGSGLAADGSVNIGGTNTAAVNVGLAAATTTNIAAAASSLGFYGVPAVAQPSTTGTTAGFTAGVGTSVNDDSTFTGNTGLAAYTIGDLVLALKQLGLLAA